MNITDKRDKSLAKDKRVVITGASSGLGKELAFLFAHEKRDLVLIARSEDKLKEIALDIKKQFQVRVKIIVLDLSESQAVVTLVNEFQDSNIQVDILINNAGFAYHGEFLKQSADSLREMLNLMVVNTTLLSSAIGKEMNKSKEGKNVQISSTSAFQAGPYMASYFASKSYLLLLSEAIHSLTIFPLRDCFAFPIS